MLEAHAGAGQQQAIAVQMFSKVAVVPSFAIGCITDDRVGDVFEVTPDLVAPTGNRFQLDKGVTTAWIAVDFDREFDFRQRPEMG
jgi:thiamine monophosphate synthase